MITQGKRIIYWFLSGVVFVVHLALVLIVSLGWLIPQLFYPFVIAITLTFLSEIFLGYCVLSKMEFSIRKKLNPTKEYDRSCIMHYSRALFGLGPRNNIEVNKNKNFFQKNSFTLLLLVLLIVGSVYHYVL